MSKDTLPAKRLENALTKLQDAQVPILGWSLLSCSIARQHAGCVTKPPALSDPPVPNVCPYDIVGPCFKQSANYGGTYQLARLLAGIVF